MQSVRQNTVCQSAWLMDRQTDSQMDRPNLQTDCVLSVRAHHSGFIRHRTTFHLTDMVCLWWWQGVIKAVNNPLCLCVYCSRNVTPAIEWGFKPLTSTYLCCCLNNCATWTLWQNQPPPPPSSLCIRCHSIRYHIPGLVWLGNRRKDQQLSKPTFFHKNDNWNLCTEGKFRNNNNSNNESA